MKTLGEALGEVLARLDETTEGEFLERLANGRAIALQCMDFLRQHGPAIAAALRAVEGAAVVEWSRDSGIACAHLRGQLVRIVPEQNP